jgi:hypothetical protein
MSDRDKKEQETMRAKTDEAQSDLSRGQPKWPSSMSISLQEEAY